MSERHHNTRRDDALDALLRLIARHVSGFWGALAAFAAVGIVIAAVLAILFIAVVQIVGADALQRMDESALRALATYRSPGLDRIMLQITSLGNGVVLIVLALVASVFLWLSHHRWSVYLLLVGMAGGKVLNSLLKAAFGRDRPSVVEWVYEVTSPSLPSGHAMGAFITYGTIAFLVGRLGTTRALRWATWIIAGVIILAIGLSRMYLGVHYPSDVLFGYLAGLAWLLFVIATIRALQFFAPRRPETREEEQHLDSGPSGHSSAPRRAVS